MPFWHFLQNFSILRCQEALFQKNRKLEVPGAKSANMALFGKFELLKQVPKCQKCLRPVPEFSQNYLRCQKCLGGTFSKIIPFRECQVPKVPASPPLSLQHVLSTYYGLLSVTILNIRLVLATSIGRWPASFFANKAGADVSEQLQKKTR